jgi:hypothetical protein
MVSQVPISPASAALQTTNPRSRRASPEAASRTTFGALHTRTVRWPDTLTTSTPSMKTSTSALAAVTPDLFLLCDLCSASSRGYPDISAQALNAAYVYENVELAGGHTVFSVSVFLSLLPTPSALRRPLSSTQLTPIIQIVAGIISLINDFLISNGEPPLGFLNTWLYGDVRRLEGFNDIISGSNPGCLTEGFPATIGWDPVSPRQACISLF